MAKRKTSHNARALACLLCISIAAVSSINAQSIHALVHVDTPVSVWSEPDVATKLLDRLSGYRGVEFEVISDSLWQANESGSGYVSADVLARFGAEYRARYIISLANLEETLQTRKGLSIPLLLSRYSQVAVLSGTLRIVDSDKGRMVVQKDFEITLKSREQWQPLENDPNKAGLRTAASEKPALFAKLEWKAADEIAADILRTMKLK